MRKIVLGEAVFVRHGESKYSQIFPDLTAQGKNAARAAGRKIRALYELYPYGPARIVSSPAVRALGTAYIIRRILGLRRVEQEPLLAAAQVFDWDKGKAPFLEHTKKGGMRGLSVAYGQDSRYEEGEVVEPRSKVRARFYKYLGALARNLLESNSKNFVVHTTHYEVLYHFVEDLFRLDYETDEPLGHAEPIWLSFLRASRQDAVEVAVEFRKKRTEVFFDYCRETLLAPSS